MPRNTLPCLSALPKNSNKKQYQRHYRVALPDVLKAHEAALRFGGRPGIREIGLIESAIARPYAGYYRRIHAKAAALTHSLAKNHGFIDGNKRTALLVLMLLLDLSGYRFVDTEETEIEQMILDVVDNKVSFAELVEWFKARLDKAP